MKKRVALYLRVSTKGQSVENQRRELEAAATHRGWEIAHVYQDAGISGAKSRDKRPGFDRLLKDATRGKFEMVGAWSVDRLGRSLQDLVAFMNDLRSLEIDLYLHKQALDTSTSSGRAMFGMLSVFGEFEREIIRERVKAGLARAKAKGIKLGRKPVGKVIEDHIRELRGKGMGILRIGRQLGIGTSVVQRVVRASKAA